MKLIKPWTPEIFMECYCVARNKPIRREITKPQTATVISLWFWSLLACPELYCDWPVHNQHSWKFSGVHSFLSLTVIAPNVRHKATNFTDPKWQKAEKYTASHSCLVMWEYWSAIYTSLSNRFSSNLYNIVSHFITL